MQIVQPGRRDVIAPFHAGLGVIEKQIVGQQILLRRTGGPGHTAAEAALLAVQGLHVHSEIVLHVAVGLTVHVDGHIGDQRRDVLQIHQTHGNTILCPHHGAARDAEGPVHPTGAQHTAVALHAETGVALSLQLGILLDLEGGAVAVGGGHHEAAGPSVGQPERDQRRAVARHIVPSAGLQRPLLRLPQRAIALQLQQLRRMIHRLKGRGTGGNIGKQRLIHGDILPLYYHKLKLTPS